jgi:hypothetical protein
VARACYEIFTHRTTFMFWSPVGKPIIRTPRVGLCTETNVATLGSNGTSSGENEVDYPVILILDATTLSEGVFGNDTSCKDVV